MRYLDTSIIVSLLVLEDTTERATQWLTSIAHEQRGTSAWAEVELAGALSRKIRSSRISIVDRDAAMDRYRTTMLPSLQIVPTTGENYRRASEIVAQHEAGIRPGDALHLAVCIANRATLCTFDKSFAAGAKALGYDVELII